MTRRTEAASSCPTGGIRNGRPAPTAADCAPAQAASTSRRDACHRRKRSGETVPVEEIRLRPARQPADRPGGRVVEFDVKKPGRIPQPFLPPRTFGAGPRSSRCGRPPRARRQPARAPEATSPSHPATFPLCMTKRPSEESWFSSVSGGASIRWTAPSGNGRPRLSVDKRTGTRMGSPTMHGVNAVKQSATPPASDGTRPHASRGPR